MTAAEQRLQHLQHCLDEAQKSLDAIKADKKLMAHIEKTRVEKELAEKKKEEANANWAYIWNRVLLEAGLIDKVNITPGHRCCYPSERFNAALQKKTGCAPEALKHLWQNRTYFSPAQEIWQATADRTLAANAEYVAAEAAKDKAVDASNKAWSATSEASRVLIAAERRLSSAKRDLEVEQSKQRAQEAARVEVKKDKAAGVVNEDKERAKKRKLVEALKNGTEQLDW